METTFVFLAVVSMFWLGSIVVLIKEFIGIGFGEMVETVFVEWNKGYALPRRKIQKILLAAYLLSLAALVVSGCYSGGSEFAALLVFLAYPRAAVIFLAPPAMFIAGAVNIWRKAVDAFEKFFFI